MLLQNGALLRVAAYVLALLDFCALPPPMLFFWFFLWFYSCSKTRNGCILGRVCSCRNRPCTPCPLPSLSRQQATRRPAHLVAGTLMVLLAAVAATCTSASSVPTYSATSTYNTFAAEQQQRGANNHRRTMLAGSRPFTHTSHLVIRPFTHKSHLVICPFIHTRIRSIRGLPAAESSFS